jgi:hypothetical protein
MFRMFRKHPKSLFASLLVVSTLAMAGPAAAQAALAKCNSNGSLVSFGGFDTASASCQRMSQGYYQVTFSGLYAVAGPDNVVLNTTAESSQWGVSNAYVISANPAQIVVGVYTWASPAIPLVDNAFFITVFTGRTPPVLPPPP